MLRQFDLQWVAVRIEKRVDTPVSNRARGKKMGEREYWLHKDQKKRKSEWHKQKLKHRNIIISAILKGHNLNGGIHFTCI